MRTKNMEQTLDRREKTRFPIHRELRYRLLDNRVLVGAGTGQSINIGSGGVAFSIDRELKPDAFIELSISWPMLLDDTCPMRLIVFGRVLRSHGHRSVCTIDKYEFRTQSRTFPSAPAVRNDATLQRWAQGMRKDAGKSRVGTIASA